MGSMGMVGVGCAPASIDLELRLRSSSPSLRFPQPPWSAHQTGWKGLTSHTTANYMDHCKVYDFPSMQMPLKCWQPGSKMSVELSRYNL